MSRGTEIYTVRIPTTLSEKLVATIARRNLGSKEQPWTTSDFVRIAEGLGGYTPAVETKNSPADKTPGNSA